jgi:foldase protein PrsA
MARHQRSLAPVTVAAVVASAAIGCLTSCGGTGQMQAASARLPRAPGGIVARVGSYAVGQGAYDRLFAAEAQRVETPISALPIPPRYSGCISALTALADRLGLPVPARALLWAKCQQRYEVLRERTLNRLLAGEWVSGAAAELGISVDSGQVQQAFDKSTRERFPTEAQLGLYLKHTGLTRSDLVFWSKVKLLAGLVRERIARQVGPLSRDRVKAYYESHPGIEGTPEKRDVMVVRAGTSVKAGLNVRREIAAGRSFASLAKALPRQPAETRDGFHPGYENHAFRQPRLNRAILSARPHVLYGPIKTEYGYYVFDVIRVHPRRQRPFREVEANIMQKLPGQIHQQALTAFETSWAAKWKARSACANGFDVSLCEQASEPPKAQVSLEAPGAFE